MKLLISLLAASLCFPVTVYGYSQDPRSCSDPRTQYPSNPPCAIPVKIAQINRTPSDRVSDLGLVNAANDYQARKACKTKGGNVVVKNLSGYRCFYAAQLATK